MTEYRKPSIANLVSTAMTTLIWDFASRWENPHFESMYSKAITLKDDNLEYYRVLSFFVSDQGSYIEADYRLILKVQSYRCSQKYDVAHFDLGNFVDTLDNKIAVANVQRYAQYVLDGYVETWNLQHCPSFERMDDVDDNFNPIPLQEVA